MTGLPATGGTWAQVLEPGLNPLAERFWQITDVLVRDYFNADGTVFNLADPSVGLGTSGLFTPFAADNLTIREDLLVTAPTPNLGFYHIGLLTEDSTSVTPDQTMTGSPSAQLVRNTRSVLTKLEDKVAFEPKESTPLVDYLLYEKPLASGVPALGTPGYQLVRGNTDVPVERILVMIGVDTDGNLLARVLTRVITDKKAKAEFARKKPDAQMLTYELLPCPYAKTTEYKCRAGSQWLASGDFGFLTFQPIVTPVTGLKATIQFPTPIDITSPVYTVGLQSTPNGSFAAATLSGSPTVAGGFTTVTIGSLTASTLYNAVQVTATGSNDTATGLVSAPFTSTAS
ncbi:hypothetical protein AWC11_07305 [Mycobacterium interjectum]|nr:hypothetical protein AWC11_07305 [Mycobacterium interjectum]